MVGFKLLQIQRLEEDDNGFYCQNSDCNKFTEYKYGTTVGGAEPGATPV